MLHPVACVATGNYLFAVCEDTNSGGDSCIVFSLYF